MPFDVAMSYFKIYLLCINFFICFDVFTMAFCELLIDKAAPVSELDDEPCIVLSVVDVGYSEQVE